jgi:hypothetical protein
MPRSTPSGWTEEVLRIHGSTPFAWLFDIPLAVSDALHVRAAITPYPEPLTHLGVTYLPWPAKLGTIEEDLEGNIPQLALTLSNHGRMLMPYFMPEDRATGPVGRDLVVRLLKVDDLTQSWRFVWRIANAAADSKQVTLRLEPENWFEIDVPQDRFQRGLCRFQLGVRASGCPYPVNAAAAYRSCNQTLQDCGARGDDMVVRSLPRLLPRMWGGFSGMAAQ